MAKKKMTMKEIRIKKNLGKTETAKAAGMTPEEYERAEENPRRLLSADVWENQLCHRPSLGDDPSSRSNLGDGSRPNY